MRTRITIDDKAMAWFRVGKCLTAVNPAKLSHPVNVPAVIDLTTHFN